jgi:hypothetical protein
MGEHRKYGWCCCVQPLGHKRYSFFLCYLLDILQINCYTFLKFLFPSIFILLMIKSNFDVLTDLTILLFSDFLIFTVFVCVRVYVCAGANWIGEYNIITRSYDSINMTNIGNSLLVVKRLVQLHKDDPVVVGMTPGTYVRTQERTHVHMYTCVHFQDFYGSVFITALSFF